MNEKRVVRILELEEAAKEDEDAADAKRWEQARLIAKEVRGTKASDLAKRLGCTAQHVSMMARTWHEYAKEPMLDRTFWQHYEMVHGGLAAREALSAGISPRVRRAQRQVPVLHEDRVEMARALLQDPKVTDAVVNDPEAGRAIRDAQFDREIRVHVHEGKPLPPKDEIEQDEWAELRGVYVGESQVPLGFRAVRFLTALEEVNAEEATIEVDVARALDTIIRRSTEEVEVLKFRSGTEANATS
jgi:hypothetical protein